MENAAESEPDVGSAAGRVVAKCIFEREQMKLPVVVAGDVGDLAAWEIDLAGRIKMVAGAPEAQAEPPLERVTLCARLRARDTVKRCEPEQLIGNAFEEETLREAHVR